MDKAVLQIRQRYIISHSTLPDTTMFISYMMMLGTNLFNNDRDKSSELISLVYELYPKLVNSRAPFAIYMLLIYGISCGRRKDLKRMIQVKNIVTHIANHKDRFGFTLYSESLLIFLNAIIASAQGEYTIAISYQKAALDIFSRNKINKNALLTYNMLIDTYQTIGNIPKMNEYKYEKRCFQEENKIPVSMFPYVFAGNR